MCCPKGKIANEYEGKCTDHPEHSLNISVTEVQNGTKIVSPIPITIEEENFRIFYGKPCQKMYILEPEDKWDFYGVSILNF